MDTVAPEQQPFRPKPSRPLQAIRCTSPKKHGNPEPCGNYALLGGTVCRKHGGDLPSVKAKAAARVEAARMRLLDNTDVAIDTLEALMEQGTPEGIRLKAAESVLDRAGIRGGFEIDVAVETSNPADAIRERMEQLRKASGYAPALESDDVIDAEVEDDDGQLALFDPT